MDNFIDKLSQRFNADKIIRANSQAEKLELERLRDETRAYDELLQEIRRLNLKNVETADQLQALSGQVSELASASLTAIAEKNRSQEEQGKQTDAFAREVRDAYGETQALCREIKETLAELQSTVAQNQEKIAQTQSSLEEYTHRESVKVYRNVQAVLDDGLKNQKKELNEVFDNKGARNKGIYILVSIVLAVSLGNLGILIARLVGLL